MAKHTQGILLLFALLSAFSGCVDSANSRKSQAFKEKDDSPKPQRTVAQRLGTVFPSDPDSKRWSAAPTLSPIELPEVAYANAIWGATGRDDHGSIYFGISCHGTANPSAALCRLVTGSDEPDLSGDAVANLRRLGLAKQATSQMKIHGKPMQANDGWVYFASMDEQGEKSDGSRLPYHGSHLWRLNPSPSASDVSTRWEHLASVPEALIATACTGRYVYALGYFQHTLYQYDTQTKRLYHVVVGSVGGHISRNFIVDLQENVYVPRVKRTKDDGFEVHLVQFDQQLVEIRSFELTDYGATANFDSHGIVGLAALRNGDIAFTTAKGALYRLNCQQSKPTELKRLGWIHPQGESYPAFLCSPDGEEIVCAISRLPKQKYQWVLADVRYGGSELVVLDPESQALLDRPGTLVYGSNTRDNQGDAFVVGWRKVKNGYGPYALRVHWPPITSKR